MERDGRVLKCPDSMNISTHTLTWSVTDRNDTMYEVYDNFNSHAHVERDYEEITGQKYESISTHTLTWSVTSRYS